MEVQSGVNMPEPKIPGRNILVVDDDESVRTSLSAALGREGYTVFTAEGPTEALELLQKEQIKLVISDHHMPDMNGIDFLKLIRERHPHVCRIMLTSDASAPTLIKSINEGEVYRFLEKPWSQTQLRVMVYFAFEAIQLADENRRLLQALRRQLLFVRGLENDFPYLAALAREEQAALIDAGGVRDAD